MSVALGKRAALDGLRGLAVLAVVLAHLQLRIGSGGMVGVDVFFVLSGFLITTLLLEERAKTGRVDVPAFYRRRAYRLFPALAAVLVVALAAALVEGDTVGQRLLHGIAPVALYSGNWWIVSGHNLGPLGHTWSLAVEEQFYLVWPLVMLLCLRFRHARRLVVGVAALGVFAALATRFASCTSGGCVYRIYHGTDTRADQLLIGCILAVAFTSGRLHRLRGTGLTVAGWASVAALAAVAVSSLTWTNRLYETVGMTGTAVLTAVIVTSVMVNGDGGLTRALSWTPLTRIGLVSYGLYLWQGLVLALLADRYPQARYSVRGAFGLVIVAVITVVSYRYLERPMMRRGHAGRGLREAGHDAPDPAFADVPRPTTHRAGHPQG